MHPWLAANLVLRPAYRLSGEPVASWLARFEQTQWLSPTDLRKHQLLRLRTMLPYVQEHVPYYRAAMAANGIHSAEMKDLEGLRRLPVLTRDDIRVHFDALKSNAGGFRSATRKTSGSSGAPLLLRKDRVATGIMNAIMWRNYGWFGIGMGDRQARVWAGPVTSRQKWEMWITDRLQNRIRLSSFVMTSRAFDSFIKDLVKFRPHYLYGYGQSLYRLAAHVLAQGADLAGLRLKAVLTTAEMVTDYQREVIRAAFQTRVVDEYGCTEAGIIAMACPEGRLHVMSDNLLVEIVKDGQVVPPGVEGEVVLTELYSSMMPLIRYKVGDRGILSSERCGCGRGLPVLEKLAGRITDYIRCPDATVLDPYVIEFFLKARPEFFNAVEQWNIRQIDESAILITLCVRKGSDGPALESYLYERFRAVSQQKLDVLFRFEDALQTERSGKTRLFSTYA